MEDEINEILKKFPEEHQIKSTSSKSEKKSKNEDNELVINLKIILEQTFKLSKLGNDTISDNKEFHFYQMDLFDLDNNKKLIASKYF